MATWVKCTDESGQALANLDNAITQTGPDRHSAHPVGKAEGTVSAAYSFGRRHRLSSSRSTKSRKSRRSIALSPACR